MNVVKHIEAQDFTTSVWLKLEELLRSRIEAHRTELESPDLSDTETAMLRARIAEDRHLLALPRHTAAARDVHVPPDQRYW